MGRAARDGRPDDVVPDDPGERELGHGEKAPHRSEGAPWPAGDTRSDGPKRPPFHVPTARGQEGDNA
jgi:hypothetical protein